MSDKTDELVDFTMHDARTNVTLPTPKRYGWHCIICGAYNTEEVR